MPSIPKHRKLKRATVLIKKAQCLRNFPKTKSYKPLCEKLKNNNNSLAKALSKEKQESQSLFSQNVALIAEVQDLGLACNKRDAVISNVLKNAKELLKMLVTMTGYVTNTISSCQEFVASSGTNMHMTCNSVGKRDSMRRLSTKSPARGVVKPMVSGYTITKPTINLSRVNMQRINSPSNLSIIEEVSPVSTRNQEMSSPRSPIAIPLRQRRCESGRVCRMPERLPAVSPRISEESERRLSKRSSRHSGRISGRLSRSKSSRLSGSYGTRCSTEYIEQIRSPRVKLNDVSKLLQNSQSINIRMLSETQNDYVSDSPENNEDTRDSNPLVTIPETPSNDHENNDTDRTTRNPEEESDNGSFNMSNQQTESTNRTSENVSSWEDPLEGPSWLFNTPQTVPCLRDKDEETDHESVYDNSTVCATTKNDMFLNSTLNNTEETERTSPLLILTKRASHMQNSKKDKSINNESRCSASPQKRLNDNSFCNVLTSPATAGLDQNVCKEPEENTMYFRNFVTQRRGYFANSDEDMDEFTLMYARQPRNMHFDINDLRLPVLEASAIKPMVTNEPEPEVTGTIQKITCPIPSVSNNSLNESRFDQSTVKLPVLLNNDYENDATPVKDKQPEKLKQKKKTKKVALVDTGNCPDDVSVYNKSNERQKKSSNKRDPSSAKVVLQKLNESVVKQRTPSPEEMYSQNSRHFSRSPVSSRTDNSSDSESSNTSTSSIYTLNRPRRKRAPTTFQEPNLRKKLRRHH